MDKETKKTDSSWVDSAGYFFATEQRGGTGSILSDFGWNRDSSTTCFLEFGEQIDSEQQQQQQQQHGSDFAESFLLPENCSSSSTCSSQALLLPEEKSGDGSTSNALVSSSSSGDEQPEKSAGSDGKPPDKPSKGRKKGQKRTRQQRFAFMTKSDVDHLEDGYRWRKYGQKAVKNSPYPRSYYRCTNSKCTVKKRVERSCEDPTIVITTYEGQHCHHTVSFPRGGVFSHEGPFVSGLNPSASQMYASTMQYRIRGHLGLTQPHQVQHEVRPSQRQPEPNSHQISDEGLLGDMVPPRMRTT